MRLVAVVGNGPVAEGAADDIDAQDVVVRFNRCGNYRASGTKTDVLMLLNWGSFYAPDTQYEDHARRLIASLQRHGIGDFEVEPVTSSGVWEWNCAMKARFIRDKWRVSDRQVIWLDADATSAVPAAEPLL